MSVGWRVGAKVEVTVSVAVLTFAGEVTKTRLNVAAKTNTITERVMIAFPSATLSDVTEIVG